MLKQPHVYKILVIVCHALVDDTGRKGVAGKTAKCYIRERREGRSRVAILRVTNFLNDLK